MSLNFPDWSDSATHVRSHNGNRVDTLLMELQEYSRYYDGEIFKETVLESTTRRRAAADVPVAMNIVKSMSWPTDAMFASTKTGQSLRRQDDAKTTDATRKPLNYLAPSTRERPDLDIVGGRARRNKYGAGVLQILPLSISRHISITRVLRTASTPSSTLKTQ